MARKSNLIQRGGRWYFNRAIPKDLWQSIGKAPFRVALQTDSLEVAMRRRPEAERQYFAKIDAALAAREAVEPRQLSNVEAAGLAARWFRQELAERTSELEAARVRAARVRQRRDRDSRGRLRSLHCRPDALLVGEHAPSV